MVMAGTRRQDLPDTSKLAQLHINSWMEVTGKKLQRRIPGAPSRGAAQEWCQDRPHQQAPHQAPGRPAQTWSGAL